MTLGKLNDFLFFCFSSSNSFFLLTFLGTRHKKYAKFEQFTRAKTKIAKCSSFFFSSRKFFVLSFFLLFTIEPSNRASDSNRACSGSVLLSTDSNGLKWIFSFATISRVRNSEEGGSQEKKKTTTTPEKCRRQVATKNGPTDRGF